MPRGRTWEGRGDCQCQLGGGAGEMGLFSDTQFSSQDFPFSFPAALISCLVSEGAPLRDTFTPEPLPSQLFPLPIVGSPLPQTGEVWGLTRALPLSSSSFWSQSTRGLLKYGSPTSLPCYAGSGFYCCHDVTTATVTSSLTLVMSRGPAPHRSSCADRLFLKFRLLKVKSGCQADHGEICSMPDLYGW